MSVLAEPTLFVDRSLGARTVPVALRQAGATVETLGDHFRDTTPDDEWVPAVTARGWVILTKDVRIGFNELERLAVGSSRARMFVLVSAQLTGADQAAAFVAALGAIRARASMPGPFIDKVHRDGRVVRWRSERELR